MYGGLGDDVCVQAVAQVNGVDVVAGAKISMCSVVVLRSQRAPCATACS